MQNKESFENLILIFTTEANLEKASKISNSLLNKKLAACVSFKELTSVFWWEDKIINSVEIQLMIKTKDSNLKESLEAIKEMHSYEIPEIIYFSAKCNKDYKDWLERFTK